MAKENSPISPLAPAHFPALPPVEGVAFASAAAGIRYQGRKDVLLALLREGTVMAGVFTRSLCPSAPVDWCRSILKKGRVRAIVVNSGNANAFTGQKGREAVEKTASLAAAVVGCTPQEIALASTGVIGEPLDATKFEGVLGDCVQRAAPQAWQEAAQAIMTTDTFPKGATKTITLDGVAVTISGIAKGAGMIAPDMATMLAFVFTDAAISAELAQKCLNRGVSASFNAITVDSDTSTSDTLLLLATGAAEERGQKPLTRDDDARLEGFAKALDEVLLDLALQVVRDGEGARKLVSVKVEGAVNHGSAKKIALSIANSPLVKTAIAGEDANWGRVVMAVGKAGEPADRDLLSIFFGPHRLAHLGARDAAYDEAQVSAYMKNPEITIRAELGLGKGEACVYTCDLTKAYVEINGDYRS